MLALILLTYIIFFLYNKYYNDQIGRLNILTAEKKELDNSISRTINQKNKKQKWFFESAASRFDLSKSEYKDIEALWPILERIATNDSIQYYWNERWDLSLKEFHKSIGFDNWNELNSFIKDNSFNSEDEQILQKSLKLKEEIGILNRRKENIKNQILSDKQKDDIIRKTGISLFAILFLLRYLVYGVRWSIKTLKE